MKLKFISLLPATDNKHKLTITLLTETGEKKVSFGAKGYSDYTIHKDDARKARYLKRHEKNENWTDPLTAGTLSRYILWNKKTVSESLKDYLKHFKIAKNKTQAKATSLIR